MPIVEVRGEEDGISYLWITGNRSEYGHIEESPPGPHYDIYDREGRLVAIAFIPHKVRLIRSEDFE